MRYLMFLLCLSFAAFSCEKEEVSILPIDSVDLELHAIFACGGELDFRDDSPEEWQTRVIDFITAAGVTVVDHELDFVVVEQQGFCGNCQFTGNILRVEVPEIDKATLLELGFRE